MTYRRWLLGPALVLALFIAQPASSAPITDFSQTSGGRALLATLSKDADVDAGAARALLASAVYSPKVIARMKSPAESRLTWATYRPIFVQAKRARQGAAYIRAHRAIFNRVEKKYGVPANVIAAIIGVETRYGRHLGSDRLIDSLATLAFDYPARSTFFRRELRMFIKLCVSDALDCADKTGSYAGAMGVPQFMPTSYAAYAVDGNRDGKRDLWNQPADIIASVANYLSRHHWQAGAPVAVPARAPGATTPADHHANKRKTTTTWRALRARGFESNNPPSPDTRVGLVELEGPHGPDYWIGYKNLFVITSYNHSLLYAMAVHELAREIGTMRMNADAG